MEFFTVILLGILCLIAYYLYKLQYPHGYAEMQNFPHAPRKLFIGDRLPTTVKGRTVFFEENLKKYGSGYTIKGLGIYAVFLCKAEHVQVILSDTENITKGYAYNFFTSWFGNGLLNSTGNVWRHQRKVLTPTFHYTILNDFLVTMNEQAAILVQVLTQKCEEQATGVATVDICPYLTRCTLDIICETSMGRQLAAQTNPNHPYLRAKEEFTALVIKRTANPLVWKDFIYKLTENGKKSVKALKVLHDFTEEVIAEKENSLETGDTDDSTDVSQNGKKRLAFLDLLMEIKLEGQFSAKEVQEQVDTFMFEGHDTTATGLMWALFCMGRNLDCQRLVQQEIEEVLGSRTEPTVADLANMTYLDLCVKESQRLYPSAPLIARTLTRPITLDGRLVPAGLTVYCAIYTLHQDPAQFPNPERFDPNRFLPENCSKRHNFAYVPFSAGPRNCIGQKFAVMKEKVILCHLLRNFHIEAQQNPTETRPLFQVVSKPDNGIILKLTPRN